MGSVSTRKDSTTVWVTSVYKDEVTLIKEGEISLRKVSRVFENLAGNQ